MNPSHPRDNFLMFVAAFSLLVGGIGAGYMIKDAMVAHEPRCTCEIGQAQPNGRRPLIRIPGSTGQAGELGQTR